MWGPGRDVVGKGAAGDRGRRAAGPGAKARGSRIGSRRGSKGSLPGSAGSHEGPLQLLIGDKHHHVPGPQSEKGGREPRREKTQVHLSPAAAATAAGRWHPVQPGCPVPREVRRAQGMELRL